MVDAAVCTTQNLSKRNDTGPYRIPYQAPEQPSYPGVPHPSASHPSSQAHPQAQATHQYSNAPPLSQYYMPPSHYFNSQYYGNYSTSAPQYPSPAVSSAESSKYPPLADTTTTSGSIKYNHTEKYRSTPNLSTAVSSSSAAVSSSPSSSLATATTGSYSTSHGYGLSTMGSSSDMSRYQQQMQQQPQKAPTPSSTPPRNNDVPELRRPDSIPDSPTESVRPGSTDNDTSLKSSDATMVEVTPPKNSPKEPENGQKDTAKSPAPVSVSPSGSPQKEDSGSVDAKDENPDKEVSQEREKLTPPPALIPVEALSPPPQDPENTDPEPIPQKDPEPEPKKSDPNAPLDPDETPENTENGTTNIAKLEAAVKENLEQAIKQHNQQRSAGFDLPGSGIGATSSPMKPDPAMQDLPRPEELFPFASPASTLSDRSPRAGVGVAFPPIPPHHLPYHNIFQRSISDPNFPRPIPHSAADFFPRNGPGSTSSSSGTSLSPPTPLKDPTIPPSFPRPPPSQPMYMSAASASPHKPTDFNKPKTPGVEGAAYTSPGEGAAGDNRFYCHLCSFVGLTKNEFNNHMNSHFEHRCPQCDYTSRTEGRLKRHIKDFHTEDENARREPGRPKSFRCRQCDFVAKEKEEYWMHARTHIKEDKVLQCTKCPFVTEYKHHLEYHLRNHYGSKPFKCSKCNYSCVNKSMLNSHMKSHTNVYQYRCADCTYATKYCHSLKLHLGKYNHQPALVLNADGSLPTDGSGDFELVSKRGPPRGPRGPRRDSLPETSSMPPGRGMMFGGGQPGLNGHSPIHGAAMLAASGFWPGMFPPPPPLIPVSAMNPLNIQMPKTPTSTVTSSSTQETRDAQDSNTLRCKACDFSTSHQSELTEHIVKVHAYENRDLMQVYGIGANGSAEMTEQQLMFRAQGLATPPKEPKPWNIPNGSMSAFPGSSPTTPVTPQPSQTSPRGSDAFQGRNGDCPLDLTNKSPNSESRGVKRRLYEDDVEEEDSLLMDGAAASSDSCPDTPMPNGNTSGNSQSVTPPPAKKSRRKGKAYKLDLQQMQEQAKDIKEALSDDDEDMPFQNDLDRASSSEDYNTVLQNSIRAFSGAARDAEHARMVSLYTGGNANVNDDAEADKRLAAVDPKDNEEAGAEESRNGYEYECAHCHISFGDLTLYTMHMGYHGYQDPFKCNMCGHTSKDKVEFFLHIARAAHE